MWTSYVPTMVEYSRRYARINRSSMLLNDLDLCRSSPLVIVTDLQISLMFCSFQKAIGRWAARVEQPHATAGDECRYASNRVGWRRFRWRRVNLGWTQTVCEWTVNKSLMASFVHTLLILMHCFITVIKIVRKYWQWKYEALRHFQFNNNGIDACIQTIQRWWN